MNNPESVTSKPSAEQLEQALLKIRAVLPLPTTPMVKRIADIINAVLPPVEDNDNEVPNNTVGAHTTEL